MAVNESSPGTSPPNDDVIAVSDEALQKAESFVEAEEGAANRLMGTWGRISTTIAVLSLSRSIDFLRSPQIAEKLDGSRLLVNLSDKLNQAGRHTPKRPLPRLPKMD